jgi:hypothetical protein
MIRDLENYNQNTGYAAKTAVPVSNFGPESYGGLIASLAIGPNSLNRPVGEVLLIVNPVDYYTKVMPAIMFQQPDGTWVSRFPFPTRVVQSAYVTSGKAILGIGRRYIAVLGTGRDGRIEYSDEYKFLEDERYYLIKLYGTGRPMDNTSFLYLDISGLKPFYPVVRVESYFDARIEEVTIDDELENTIDIGFNENIHFYATDVEDDSSAGDNNTLTMTVTPKDSNATVVVKKGSSTISPSNGEYTITLAAGLNVITVTSTVGDNVETYIIVVTYTPIAAGDAS